MQDSIEGENTPTPLMREQCQEVLKGLPGYSEDKIVRIKKEQEERFQELKDTKLTKPQ